MARRKRLICTVHDEIFQCAEELRYLDYSKSVKTQVARIAKRIQKDAMEAKEYGQSMENRLDEYKVAIEDIGFKRKKNK